MTTPWIDFLRRQESSASWPNSIPVLIAREIDATRDWSLLGILADALEDAGLQDRETLKHCRDPSQHAGHHALNVCFVVMELMESAGRAVTSPDTSEITPR